VELTFGIIGAVTGIAGLLSSFFSLLHNRIEALKAYFEYERDAEFIKARREVYSLGDSGYEPESIASDKEKANSIALLMSFYHFSGIMVKKHQLPMWIFKDTAAGTTVVRMYEILEPYIKWRRDSQRKNPSLLYANNFE